MTTQVHRIWCKNGRKNKNVWRKQTWQIFVWTNHSDDVRDKKKRVYIPHISLGGGKSLFGEFLIIITRGRARGNLTRRFDDSTRIPPVLPHVRAMRNSKPPTTPSPSEQHTCARYLLPKINIYRTRDWSRFWRGAAPWSFIRRRPGAPDRPVARPIPQRARVPKLHNRNAGGRVRGGSQPLVDVASPPPPGEILRSAWHYA